MRAVLGHTGIVLTADTDVSVLPEVAHHAAQETAQLVLLYEVSFRMGRWQRRELPSTQPGGHLT